MTAPRLGCPDFGIGVGLRVPHYRHILQHHPEVGFFEIISENFMVPGGKPVHHLEQILEHYRVIQHGVSLDIGGPEELDREYLKQLKALTRKVRPAWLSDHLCWCGSGNAHLHDLLPLPYTEEAITRVVERARMVQDFLELPFALENTSSYMTYTHSVMPEWQFVAEIVERANIGLMFDVNNVYVSAYNHGFDPYDYIRAVPHERIVQIHLAGHTNRGAYIIDTHQGPIIDPVWELYAATIELTGAVPTLIEWDDAIPQWPELAAEAERASQLRAESVARRDALLAAGKTPSLSGRGMQLVRSAGATAAEASAGSGQGGPSEHAGGQAVSAA
jgi:uncharacterized protein (UPF0276 family)